MANSINLITKYSAEVLDEVFMNAAVTSILEGDHALLKFINAKTVMIPSITMSGLGDYSRSTGFPKGGVNVAWTSYTLSKDRGIEFTIDAMDDEETAGVAYGALANEFIRTREVPEIDAYRLSTLYSKATTANKSSATIAANTIISKFNNEIEGFANDEVNTDEVVGFISTEVDKLIKNTTELDKKIGQADYTVGNVTFKVRKYEGIPLVTVPKSRFKTAYTYEDDPSGTASTPGFTATSSALDLNYLFVHKRSALPIMKHAKTRVFAPDVNQNADGWLFQHRVYHDIICPSNKLVGIRACTKPAASQSASQSV